MKEPFKPSFYSTFEDMRHSEHWHYHRLQESFFGKLISDDEWSTLLDEFTQCGMSDTCVTDSQGVDWRDFYLDYTQWLYEGNAY